MAYNYEYPYTDFSRANSDWMLKKIRELADSYETILLEQKQLNEKITELENTIDDKIADTLKPIVDELNRQISDIKQQMSDISAEINKRLDDNEEAMQNLVLNNRKEMQELEERINKALNDNIEAVDLKLFQQSVKNKQDIEAATKILQEQVADLSKKIDDFQTEAFPIHNPVSGTDDSIATTTFDIWEALRVHGLDAAHYDALQISCDEFKSRISTCTQYAVDAERIFASLPVFNSVTGRRDTIQNALATIATLGTTNPITADEYSAADLTADEYKALNITAYLYDIHAKDYIA